MARRGDSDALERLRGLVATVQANPDDKRSFAAYLEGLSADAADLAAAGPAVRIELGRLSSSGGTGWVQRADLIRQVVRDYRRESAGPSALALDMDTTGRPRRTASNAQKVLAGDPTWSEALRLNLLTDRVEWEGAPLTDEMVTEIGIQIDRQYSLVLDEGHLGRVLRLVAKGNEYHPVRDYLNGLRWDGVPRLGGLLSGYFGASLPEGEAREPGDDGSGLLDAIGTRWMVSAVARAMRPGCKVDTVLILQGRQGQRKSTALEVLGGAWFRSSRLEIDNKDVYQQVAGCWIYEIQEIDGMLTRKHASDLKSFVSNPVDSYRRPYGENLHDQPRGCVFAGTTNTRKILLDPTGSRRFWPVALRDDATVDLAALREDRDALWAEAVHLYKSGTQWHLTDEEDASLNVASESFRSVDLWEEHVARYIDANQESVLSGFTTTEVLSWMQIPADRHGDVATERIQRILQAAGFRSHRLRRDGVRVYVWRRA